MIIKESENELFHGSPHSISLSRPCHTNSLVHTAFFHTIFTSMALSISDVHCGPKMPIISCITMKSETIFWKIFPTRNHEKN